MVILFHLGYAWIPGGFVGVDVFFVLSGYLITGLLVGESATNGRVGLQRFYSRRVRRLLPASICVLVVVMAMGHWLLDPVQQQSLGWDATFSALYSANWRFALAGGDYFAPGDVPSALVHYWSLAVEEQFYFVWPASVLVMWKVATRFRRRNPLGVLFAATAVFVAASAVASVVFASSSISYYGTHTRAYQLLSGGLLTLAARRWPLRLPDSPRGRAGAVALTGAGLLALLALGHFIPDARNYPGWPGLAVTAASLALIAGVDLGPTRTLGAWVFGSRPMAAIGRLSYSLYIWHWPIVVLLPVLVKKEGKGFDWLLLRPVMGALIAALAMTSYFVVERPIRFRLWPSAKAWKSVAVGLSCSVLVGVASFAIFQPDSQFKQEAFKAVRDLAKPGACPYFSYDWPSAAKSHPCVYRKGTGPVIAFVGDSHAQQWQPAFEVLAEKNDATLIRVTRGGCPANDVTAYAHDDSGRNVADKACTAWRHKVYAELVRVYDPDVIFVATRSHVRGIQGDGANVLPNDPRHLPLWAASWDWTVRTLTSGKAKVVISEIDPTMPRRVPSCLIQYGKGTKKCDFKVSDDQVVGPYNAAIAALASRPHVEVVDPTSIGCPDGTCPAMIDGVIVHRDDNHLSATFVRDHTATFAAMLAKVGITF